MGVEWCMAAWRGRSGQGSGERAMRWGGERRAAWAAWMASQARRTRRIVRRRGGAGTVEPQRGRLVSCSRASPRARSLKLQRAMGSQTRSAQAGSVMRVCSQCQKPRLLVRKPCSIQFLGPYQAMEHALGAQVGEHQPGVLVAGVRTQGARRVQGRRCRRAG